MSNQLFNLTNLNKKLFIAPRASSGETSQQQQPFPTAIPPAGGYPRPVAASLAMKDKPFALPRLNNTQKAALTNLVDGMSFYNTSTNQIENREGGVWVDAHKNDIFLFHNVTLGPQDLVSLNTTPFLLVSSTSTTNLLIPIKVTTIFKQIGEAYNGISPIRVVYYKPPTAGFTNATSLNISEDTYGGGSDNVGFLYGVSEESKNLNTVLGAGLYLTVDTPITEVAISGSNGTLTVEIVYANQSIVFE